MLPDKNELERWVESLSTDELEKLFELVQFEPGTQVYRQQRFEELFNAELNRSRRNVRRLSLAILRLDNFNELTHRFGAAVTAGMMKEIGNTVKQYLREADIPIRYGVDGFAIIMPEAPSSGGQVALSRICDKILDNTPPMESAGPVKLSFGLAEFPTDSRESIELEWRAKEALTPYIRTTKPEARKRITRDQVLTDIAWHLMGGTTKWDEHCAGLMREHGITTDEVRTECRKLMD